MIENTRQLVEDYRRLSITINSVLIPLIRRVMPQLLVADILGVQPMTGPVGQIFTMKSRYAGTHQTPSPQSVPDRMGDELGGPIETDPEPD